MDTDKHLSILETSHDKCAFACGHVAHMQRCKPTSIRKRSNFTGVENETDKTAGKQGDEREDCWSDRQADTYMKRQEGR